MKETVVNEIKTVVLKRYPPGDRWKSVVYEKDSIFESLTAALEFHFQKSGETQFYISARDGEVSVVKNVEVEIEPTITKYSLYGEY
jgi:hypothetical protein